MHNKYSPFKNIFMDDVKFESKTLHELIWGIAIECRCDSIMQAGDKWCVSLSLLQDLDILIYINTNSTRLQWIMYIRVIGIMLEIVTYILF